MTERDSITKIIPTMASITSNFVKTATVPNKAPSDNEPVSPMNIFAGKQLYHKKPKHAPIVAAHIMLMFPNVASVCMLMANMAVAIKKNIKAGIKSPAASPSKPSLKFTEFDVPAITNISKGM